MTAADCSAAATVSCRDVRSLSGARLAAPWQAGQGRSRLSPDHPGTFAMGGGAARRSRLVTLAGPSCPAIRSNAGAMVPIAGRQAQAAFPPSPGASPACAWSRPCADGWHCSLFGWHLARGCGQPGQPADLGHLACCSAFSTGFNLQNPLRRSGFADLACHNRLFSFGVSAAVNSRLHMDGLTNP